MSALLLRMYRLLFAHRFFHRFNILVYRCSLRGLGILNYESDDVSGETFFLRSRLLGRTNCVILDVGANVGHYAGEALKINPNAHVYAFEPHPKTYARLTAAIAVPNFHAYNLAVGHEAGQLSLYDYADDDGSQHASIFKDVVEDIHKRPSVEHRVEIIALQSFIERESIGDIDLLKVDTEGNELNVLKGLGGILAEGRIRAIHFEFNEMNVVSRTFFKDFWDLMPNYAFYRMLPRGLQHIPEYNVQLCEIFAYQNIVAIVRDRQST